MSEMVMRKWRRKQGVSQDQLAKIIGVATSTISQIERKVNHPRRV